MAADTDTTHQQPATFEKRAEQMLAAIVKADDLPPRARVLVQCILESLLEATCRIAALEKAPMQYLGVHEAGRRYTKGSFVSEGGSIWAAMHETTQRPGDGPDWQLAVKKGRDAR